MDKGTRSSCLPQGSHKDHCLPSCWKACFSILTLVSMWSQETWVRFLVWEDPQEKDWQPTPVFLPGESSWTEEPGGLQSVGSQRVGHD